MKKYRKLAVYVLIFAFLLTGCGDQVIAKVNGVKITETELSDEVERIAVMHGYDLDGEHGALMRNVLEEQTLEALIMKNLVLQEAKARKITVDKKKIKEEIQNIKDNFSSKKEYKEFLTANKLTEKELFKTYETMYIYEALFDEITKDITEPSEDPAEYYNENTEEFFRPEMVQVRHVLVDTKEEAEAILEALASGADFKELALEKSTDPSVTQNEGLMEYFPRGGYMVEEFEEAAFALSEIGEYTQEPVKTDYGFHIIKLEGRQEEKQMTFEEVKEQLIERLLAQDKSEKFRVFEDELLAKAEIEKLLPEDETEDLSGEMDE